MGKSLFPKPEPGRVISLSDGVDLWVGVFQSVAIGKRAYLNIDGNLLIQLYLLAQLSYMIYA